MFQICWQVSYNCKTDDFCLFCNNSSFSAYQQCTWNCTLSFECERLACLGWCDDLTVVHMHAKYVNMGRPNKMALTQKEAKMSVAETKLLGRLWMLHYWRGSLASKCVIVCRFSAQRPTYHDTGFSTILKWLLSHSHFFILSTPNPVFPCECDL